MRVVEFVARTRSIVIVESDESTTSRQMIDFDARSGND